MRKPQLIKPQTEWSKEEPRLNKKQLQKRRICQKSEVPERKHQHCAQNRGIPPSPVDTWTLKRQNLDRDVIMAKNKDRHNQESMKHSM
jgi:hypothetical protein